MPPLKSIASARVVLPEPELPRRAIFLIWSAWNVFMFRWILYDYLFNILCLGRHKNNNFLKTV
jgi:hypothetical protein